MVKKKDRFSQWLKAIVAIAAICGGALLVKSAAPSAEAVETEKPELLVIESITAESQSMVSMLGEELHATVVNVNDADKMPKTLDELRDYDEVMLVNIANRDLPEFSVLHSVVLHYILYQFLYMFF